MDSFSIEQQPPPQEPQPQANQDVVRVLDALAERPAAEQVEILVTALTQVSQSGGLPDQQIGILKDLLATEELKNRLTAESPHESENELKSKARELAAATRERGMGLVTGQFPVAYYDEKRLMGQAQKLGFSQGSDLAGNDNMYLLWNLQYEKSRNWEPGTRVWTSSIRVAPNQRVDKQCVSDKVTRGWVKYSFSTPTESVYDKHRRGGTYTMLYTFVPPEVAAEIDNAVAQNPLFPNEYFQALYPDLIGIDTDTHLKRLPATKLVKIDYRTSPDKPTETVVDYPEPIPY